MTHLSCFSGIGGIDLAAHWAGFETVQFVERDPFCQKVLAKNFPGVPIHDDVTTYKHEGESPTIISAGFPCQPHSLTGLRKGSDDERDLWSEVVRILREATPRCFLGENVAGLFSSDAGSYFGGILRDLARLGYRVGWGKYGACDVGAPHERERVFIVAYTESIGRATPSKPWVEIHPESARSPGTTGSDLWNEIARIRDAEDWNALSKLVARGDDGLPHWLDRRRALGNAVVPQQVLPILQAIADFEQGVAA